jgi:hypothetical protein
MATVDDPRIGKYRENGTVERWPQTDAVGGKYTRPPTTEGIGERHFVVLPMRPLDEGVIEEIEALVIAAETPAVEVPQVEVMETAAEEQPSVTEAPSEELFVQAPAEEQPTSFEVEPRSSRRGNRSEA